jgi:hypothetical protein
MDLRMNQTSFWDNSKREVQEILPIPITSDGSTPDTWLGGIHPEAQLEVTSGFHLHADKFSRVITFLLNERQSEIAVYEQLTKATGMSRTQIQAFMQYAVHMQLLVPRTLEATPLAQLINSQDPFFDRIGTLWLLHYIIASNPLILVWNYMCNSVLTATAEITLDGATKQFYPFIGRWTESSILRNVRDKELHAFFAGYTKAMFASLNYLKEINKKTYVVQRDAALVPSRILLATTLVHRDRFHPGASGVEIPTLIHGDNSPGKLMRQREVYIRQSLDELHETGLLTIESKANLDQVRFKRDLTWLDTVRDYYQTLES